MPFAPRLREALKRRRVTNRDLARAVGVSRNTVSNWTCGRSEPSSRHLRTIARVLEARADELLGEPERFEMTVNAQAATLVERLASLELDGALTTLEAHIPSLLDVLRDAQRVSRAMRDESSPQRDSRG